MPLGDEFVGDFFSSFVLSIFLEKLTMSYINQETVWGNRTNMEVRIKPGVNPDCVNLGKSLPQLPYMPNWNNEIIL